MRCYIFDIDGTVADASHRLHHIQKQPKDWDAFFAACIDDLPIEHIVGLTHALSHFEKIVYVSGRSDQVRNKTEQWLKDFCCAAGTLYMRKAGDHRPDNIIKAELLDQILADGYEPIMAFEDREQVVQMWRANGVPCAQVAEGKF